MTAFRLKPNRLTADPVGMTAFLHMRRKPAAKRRRVLVDVTNHWHVGGDQPLREVVVRDYDGQVRRTYLPDEHPALVSWLAERAAAAVAA
jgi:hypothetical protein